MQKYFFKIIIQPVARFYWRVFKPKTYGSRAVLVCGDEIMLVKNAGAKHFTLPGGKIVNTDAKDFKTQYELDDAGWFKFTDLPQDLGPAATRRIKEFQSGERGVVGTW